MRRRLDQFHIPTDLTGKRLLDIGAWDGWFSFEMERRGAQVLAVDSTKNTRLLEAKRLLGSKISYHIADICRLTHKHVGTFDVVLFLGVLYHVKHPILALENVCGMTRDMACIESFVSDPDPSVLPVMEFYETTELRGQLDNWVGPNAAGVRCGFRIARFRVIGHIEKVSANADNDMVLDDDGELEHQWSCFTSAMSCAQRCLPVFMSSEMRWQSGVSK